MLFRGGLSRSWFGRFWETIKDFLFKVQGSRFKVGFVADYNANFEP